MSPSQPPAEFYRDQYLISTSPALLQPQVINEAFGSEYMFWTKSMSSEGLKTMLENSYNFGLYLLPEGTVGIAGRTTPTQIGYARLITDHSTYVYLTDVFVLPQHQGKGLGKWLLRSVKETLDTWPDLRVTTLYAGNAKAVKFYEDLLGMKKFESGKNGVEIMNLLGPGDVMGDAH